jgi:tetratricopeptide (TPR) repeat protein
VDPITDVVGKADMVFTGAVGRGMQRDARGLKMGRRLGCALGAAALVALSGCAAPMGGSAADVSGRPAREALRGLMSKEDGGGRGAADAPAAGSGKSLEAVLGEISAGPGPRWLAGEGAKGSDSAESRGRAARLYTSGRMKSQAGNTDAAIKDFENAAALDPGSGELWLALGEAQLAGSRRVAAGTSLQRAAKAGLESRRLYWLLAIEAERANRVEEQLWLLAKARGMGPGAGDETLGYVIDAALGKALAVRGDLVASDEAYRSSLGIPEEMPGPSAYREEVLSLLRRRGDLWLEIGDRALLRGDVAVAQEALEKAGELGSINADDILERRVGVAREAGRTGEICTLILGRLEESGGLATGRLIGLIDETISGTSSAKPMARAISELRASLKAEGPIPASVESGLVRAEAAAWPGGAAKVLRARLAEAPEDRAVLSAWLDDPASGGSERGRVLRDLVRANPDQSAAIAERLLDSGVGVYDVLGRMAGAKDDASRLLRAEILLGLGRGEDALAGLPRDRWTSGYVVAGLEFESRAAASAGDWGRFESALTGLNEQAAGDSGDAAVEVGFGRGRALLAAQRYVAAWRAVEPVVERDSVAKSLSRTLMAARIAMRAGENGAADRLLRRGLLIDARDERLYEGLVSLLGSQGGAEGAERGGDRVGDQPGDRAGDPAGAAAAASAALTDVARQVRQNIPSSRLLRWFGAQDQLAKGQYAEARRGLLRLAAEEPTAGPLLDLLVTSVLRGEDSKASAEVEAWLRESAARHPDAAGPRLALARLLSGSSRFDEALAVLEAGNRRPVAMDVVRAREGVLRAAGRTGEARALAEERLGVKAGGGRSIDGSIEWASMLGDDSKFGEAAAALAAGVPAESSLSESQRQMVLGIVGKGLASTSLAGESAAGLVELVSWAGERGVRLSPQMHDQHVLLLARSEGVSDESLLKAAELARTQYPSLGDNVYRRMGQALVDAKRLERAASFLVLVLRERPGVSSEVVIQAVQAVRGAGSRDVVVALLSSFDAPGRVADVMRKLNIVTDVPLTEQGQRAELAFTLGLMFSEDGREDLAELAYRKALEADPSHGWSNNNLGYSMAERGENLDEAETLLVRALATLPEDGSVLDSLGWVRYKRGRVNDGVDALGRAYEGAVKLLQRAAASAKGQGNPTILDHAGDALWRAGNAAAAKELWTRANAAAGSVNRMLSQQRDAPPAMVKKYQQMFAETGAKLAALAKGEEPPVSPFAAGVVEAGPGAGKP